MSALDATRCRFGRAQGFRFADMPAELAERIPVWIEARDVPDAQVIKAGRVYRYRDWLVKLTGPRRSLRDLLRAGPAIRSANLHARLKPLRTPRPLVALEWRSALWLSGSLYVGEFIHGAQLFDVWPHDTAAIRAFPEFMATMHRARIVHGDFHPWNLLWNGSEWVLIDLDAIRGPLHALRLRAIAEQQWARTLRGLKFDERLKPVFESYLAHAAFAWPADETWRRIEALARAMPPLDWTQVPDGR